MKMEMNVEVEASRIHLMPEPINRRIPFHHELSHVCRRWRSIAWSCPDLWSIVPHTRRAPEWTEFCLSLCTDGPIDFLVSEDSDWGNAQYQQAILLVIPHLHRVRAINLAFSSHPLEPGHRLLDNIAFLRHVVEAVIQAFASQSAMLEEVDIRWPYPLTDGTVTNITYPTADDTSLELFPRLWMFRMENYIATGLSPARGSSLRHLVLDDVQCWHDVNGMIRCLQALPLLEYFVYHLSGALDDDAPFNATRSRIKSLRCVQLHHLRYLEVDSMFPVQAALFSHLAIPLSATVETRCFYDHHEEDLCEQVTMTAEAMAAHLTSDAALLARFDKITLDIYSMHASSSVPRTRDNKHLPAHFEIGLPSDMAIDHITYLFNTFLSLPPVRQAHEVEIGEDLYDRYPEYTKGLASSLLVPTVTLPPAMLKADVVP